MRHRIKLCFSGWIRGLYIDRVYDTHMGREIDIPDSIDKSEIIDNLNSGRWTISLSASLLAPSKSDVEMFDFATDNG